MTEQEAINRIKYRISTASEIVGTGENGNAFEDFNMAIKALEEIQQYRLFGTPEECREAVEKLRKVEEVVKEWDKVGYAYSNNHMCEIKMIVKGGGVNE